MPEIPTPTKQMLKTAEQIDCCIPLSCVKHCRYKMCPTETKTEFVNYQIDQTKHLAETDNYWTDFLKAQQESTANYLYNFKIFGDNKDHTLVKKEPFPENLIHQRLLHMPYVGGLLKADMYYILSFILNIKALNRETQQKYMELLQNWKLLDLETLNYMQIIARHPNSGLNSKEQQQFQNVSQYLIERMLPKDAPRNYFHPDYIFIKCMVEIDPYELAYLKSILEIEGKLNQRQFLYLVNFVERLQEMPVERRDKYLNFLQEKNILETSRFDTLVAFMRSKAKKSDKKKLKLMLKELFKLMDIQPCKEEPEEIPVKKPTKFIIDINYMKLWRTLYDLEKPGIPNIVRVTYLKNFLKDVLLLQPYQMEDVFIGLKHYRVLDVNRYKFIENFIASGKLGKVEPEKKKILLNIMKQVVDGAPSTGILMKVNVPAPKGPHKIENNEVKKAPAKPVEAEKAKEVTKEAENKEKEKEKEKETKGVKEESSEQKEDKKKKQEKKKPQKKKPTKKGGKKGK